MSTRSEVASVAEQMIDGGVDLIQLRGKDAARRRKSRTIAAELHCDHTKARCSAHHQRSRRDRAESCSGGRACRTGRSSNRGSRGKSPARIAWSENRLTASTRPSAPFTKAPITLASARFSRRRRNPIIRRSAWRRFGKVHDAVRIPIFCIGGIKLDNLPEVIAAGARRVVIVSGLLAGATTSHRMRALRKTLLNRQSQIENQKS